MIARRRLLALTAAAAGCAVVPRRVRAAGAPRLAAIDWAALETALAMGLDVAAGAELRQYRTLCVEPALPAGIVDIGLRGAPNYELLRMVAPDLVLISNFYERQRGSLERIAPLVSLPVHTGDGEPYARAEAAARTLGHAVGRVEAAEALIARTAAILAAARRRLPRLHERPVFLVNLGDARHFRAFGPDSLFGDVLHRLVGHNAWEAASRYSATAPVEIQALAEVPEAALVVIGPTPPAVLRAMAEGTIWQALPMVSRGRTFVLPSVDHYGGLPAAGRFARLLAEALTAPGDAA